MGIAQGNTGSYIMTSVLLPRAVVEEIKKKGLTYRGLIVRGLEMLDKTTLSDIALENKRLTDNIARYQVRLQDLQSDIDRLKREVNKNE